MPNHKRLHREKCEMLTDSNGEVRYYSKSWEATLQTEDDYVKLYLDNLEFLCNLPKRSLNMLIFLLKESDYADKGGYLMLPAGEKEILRQKLCLEKISSVNNAIYELVKGKVLIREGKGIYKFNPWLFSRGHWKNIVTDRENNEQLYYDTHGKCFSDYVSRKGDEEE